MTRGQRHGGFGRVVLAETAHRAMSGQAPVALLMLGVGALALAAHIVCRVRLTRHRSDDINMQSSWICSRNDRVAHSGVIVAGGLVWAAGSLWPDVIVGTVIAALFLQSAVGVLRDGRRRDSQARQTEKTTAD